MSLQSVASMASYPFEFHPESLKVLQYLAKHVSTKSREELPIEVIRAAHFQRSQDLSQCDDKKFDVTRSEEIIPSPYDAGKFLYRSLLVIKYM